MKKSFKAALFFLLFFALFLAIVLYIATQDIAVLDPVGLIGKKEKDLIVTSTLLMLIVVIPVFLITFWLSWKYRETNKDAKHEPDWEHNSIAECCWWGVPFLIIIVLAILTYKSSHELNPFKPIKNGKEPIEIQVVALEWKWLFLYPKERIATINYIEFPKDRPIDFSITADAPMNSFWIPKLGGQIYAMPAMRSKLHLIAEKEGSFRGASANISGKGFAGMTFIAKATSESEYASWLERVKDSPKTLTKTEYQNLLVPSENHPVEEYRLLDGEMFDQIIEKYMRPG